MILSQPCGGGGGGGVEAATVEVESNEAGASKVAADATLHSECMQPA